jgi:hypothetical protein
VDGKIDKLTFSIAPPVLTEDDKKQEVYRRAGREPSGWSRKAKCGFGA